MNDMIKIIETIDPNLLVPLALLAAGLMVSLLALVFFGFANPYHGKANQAALAKLAQVLMNTDEPPPQA